MTVSEGDVTKYLKVLGQHLSDDQIKTDPESCTHYGQDWTRFATPRASAVVFPKTVEQVQSMVQLANEHSVALVVSGGRTGLSGGAVACQGEVVLSLDRLNQIVEKNLADRTVTVQAGMVTAQLHEVAESMGLFYPVDFASSGSSQVGGNIATNAGGIRVIRYGLTRDWVAGLKVVLPTGELVELNHGLVKNATGYDLRHLLVGSEGTLGVIVEATFRLTNPPKHQKTIVLGLEKMPDLMSIMASFQQKMTLSAFEFFSEKALGHVLNHSQLQRPFEQACPYYALIEVDGVDEHIEEHLFSQFEHCMESGWVLDGVISQNETQREALWALRERISESITPRTPYKNDISVCISQVPEFLDRVDALVCTEYPDFEIVWFGHVGDGNVHLNILRPEAMAVDEFKSTMEVVSEKVYHLVGQFKGSVSAEHGVGLLKKDALRYSKSEAEMHLMRQIKALFDPKGILNPGKLI